MALVSPRLYFAYGSSLALSEMLSRCPTSSFYSMGLLRNHRWFVNERGYANVMPSAPGPNGLEDVVWGILYTLRQFDEELLDKHEGLPWAYSKEDMDVEAVSITGDGRGTRREIVRALVYIDRERVQESYAWPAFVVKMNRGIKEAIERGIPKMWFDSVVRSYIPEAGAVNAAEQEIAEERGLQAQNGARSAAIATPGSDRASHTQDSVAGGQSMNGTSQQGGINHGDQLHGLENSKYAQEVNVSGAHIQKEAKERYKPAPQKKPIAKGAQNFANKRLECWFFKVKGSCRFSDEECPYAHHDTGVLADPPGKKEKGPQLERNGSLPHSRRAWQQEKGKPGNNIDKENNSHPDGYSQDWTSRQRDSSVQQVKHDTTDAPSGKEVENLMDSQPEWLVANDRTDVKW